MPSSDLIERYSAGERSFVGEEIDALFHEFTDANFSFADFSHSFISASFRNANLEGTKFFESNVKCCDFTGANLKNACFVGAAICGAVFDDANLEGASFHGAHAYGYVFDSREQPSVMAPNPALDTDPNQFGSHHETD